MTLVVLQPAGSSEGSAHFNDTIERPVRLSLLAEFLTPAEVTALEDLYPDREVPTWGVTPGEKGVNRKKWDRIRRGNRALFSKSGGVFASGVITMKTHNASLARELWKTNKRGDTWEYMYFIDELKPMTIMYGDFNHIVGYEPNNVIQGFTVLNAERSERVLEALDLWSEIHSDVTSTEYTEMVSGLDPSEPLDGKTTAKRRKEQSFLRARLFDNQRVAPCHICGRVLSVDLLVAAHVKRRSVCKPNEMLDFEHIVIPMCYLGCDRLYEKGYLTVEEGTVKVLHNPSHPADLREMLDALDGLPCPGWNSSTEPYFQWHREHHGFT